VDNEITQTDGRYDNRNKISQLLASSESLSLFFLQSSSLYHHQRSRRTRSQIQRCSLRGIEHRGNSANNYNFRWETTIYIYIYISPPSYRPPKCCICGLPLVLSSFEFLASKFCWPRRLSSSRFDSSYRKNLPRENLEMIAISIDIFFSGRRMRN